MTHDDELHDHDRGLSHDLPMLSRRRTLTLFGAPASPPPWPAAVSAAPTSPKQPTHPARPVRPAQVRPVRSRRR
jgi:hypothetical protein